MVLGIIRNNTGIRTSELIDEAQYVLQPLGQDLDILDNRNDDKF
ncbi:MAG: hypothetical protein RR239_06080 [Oscillospiraceae bacterium]